MDARKLLGAARPVIGVVHLAPLPGSPRHQAPLGRIVEAARADMEALVAAGVDALLVENFGDVPFFPEVVPPITVASMTRVVADLRPTTPFGVNVLRNDAVAALSIAHATGARFIRVNVHAGAVAADQGVLAGRAHDTLRLRAALGADVAILADLRVKHATPLGSRPIAEEARDTAERALADGLIVSGSRTGSSPSTEDLAAARAGVPDALLLVGSGATVENVGALLRHADGVIVGTSLKRDGRVEAPVDRERAARFVDAFRRAAR